MENNLKFRIGKKLSYFRKRKKLSQKEVADHFKVDTSTISKHENGIREPDMNTLQRYASLYDISVMDIVGEEIGQGEDVEENARIILNKIQNLPKDKQDMIFSMLDALVENVKDQIKKS